MNTKIPDFSIEKSHPLFSHKTNEILSVLRGWSLQAIKTKMKVSDSISIKTFEIYKNWNHNDLKNGSPAIFLYDGTAFKGLCVDDFNYQEIKFTNDNLFILSGLYGLLKPLDIIHPYRLEMALKFQINEKADTLYKYWRNDLTSYLNNNFSNELIINLASDEYFKVLDKDNLTLSVLNCHFLEIRNGIEKVIANHAKKARGLLTRFIIKNKLSAKQDLKSFNLSGYNYRNDLSDEDNYYFSRIH
tara:strand:+ start:14657 stop:15388 length:732 start_codon:yes stop_codon:yes gene_type:complete